MVTQSAATAASCGVERWSVKTGTDADAGKITLPAGNRIQPTETTVYRLQVTLTEYKLESDSDLHALVSSGQPR